MTITTAPPSGSKETPAQRFAVDENDSSRSRPDRWQTLIRLAGRNSNSGSDIVSSQEKAASQMRRWTCDATQIALNMPSILDSVHNRCV